MNSPRGKPRLERWPAASRRLRLVASVCEGPISTAYNLVSLRSTSGRSVRPFRLLPPLSKSVLVLWSSRPELAYDRALSCGRRSQPALSRRFSKDDGNLSPKGWLRWLYRNFIKRILASATALDKTDCADRSRGNPWRVKYDHGRFFAC